MSLRTLSGRGYHHTIGMWLKSTNQELGKYLQTVRHQMCIISLAVCNIMYFFFQSYSRLDSRVSGDYCCCCKGLLIVETRTSCEVRRSYCLSLCAMFIVPKKGNQYFLFIIWLFLTIDLNELTINDIKYKRIPKWIYRLLVAVSLVFTMLV